MFKTQHFIVIIGVASFLFAGCDKGPGVSSSTPPQEKPLKPFSGPPEVTSEEEEDFHDLVFYIQDYKQLPDGTRSILAIGTHKGQPLGLEVVLAANWRGGSLGNDVPLTTYGGTVTYRSAGTNSDAFIRVLDELYGTKLNPKGMAAETKFTGMSLEGDPGDLSKGPVKIKMFYEPDKQEDYAEFFTDIELDSHRLEIREKDQDYRAPMVRALQTH